MKVGIILFIIDLVAMAIFIGYLICALEIEKSKKEELIRLNKQLLKENRILRNK